MKNWEVEGEEVELSAGFFALQKRVKIYYTALARWLSWLECRPVHQKWICGFDSWSGHTPRLRVQSLVRACTGSNGSIFISHFDVSLSISLSLPLTPLLPLSLKSANISLGKDFLKIYYITLMD